MSGFERPFVNTVPKFIVLFPIDVVIPEKLVSIDPANGWIDPPEDSKS